MYAAPRSIPAVLLLFISSLSGTVAFPQAVKFIRNAADPRPLANLPVGRATCTGESGSAVSVRYAGTAATADSSLPCDRRSVSVPSVNLCDPANTGQIGCHALRDPVEEDLAARGKPGQKILRAREKVLEILETENACSGWFREKDSNPADTFRTLSFEIDHKGEDLILESRSTDALTMFRNPYVAKVFQAEGRYATITINTNGAFFKPAANAVEFWKDGGVATHRGPRPTNVGPYPGDTMRAQVLVLLHEFGHVLDLLPIDENDVDGKSVQNTVEVLRFCRTEVETKVRRATLSAAR
jgi:hypothetical protein